jgi:ABC-type Fe3+/spermidine/putrescine transport system ATPase subunit
VGRTNFFSGKIEKVIPGSGLHVSCDIGEVICAVPDSSGHPGTGESVTLAIRPEEVVLLAASVDHRKNVFEATVVRTMFAGNRAQCDLKIGSVECQAELGETDLPSAGEKVRMHLPPDRIRLFRPIG